MALEILSSSVAAAVAAATTQDAHAAALVAPWAGGNVTVRVMNADALLATLTQGPWVQDNSADPRDLTLGARLARTFVTGGTPTRVVFRSGSTDIFSLSAGVGSGDVSFAAAISSASLERIAGITITAATALPKVTYASAFTIALAASSGATGSAVSGTVTPTGGPLSAAATVTLSCGTGTFADATLDFASGATAAQAFSFTPTSDTTHSVSMTNTLGLLNTGSPRSYTSTTSGTATTATLSGSTTGTTGSPSTWTVTLDGPVPSGGGTVSISASGATLSSSTLTFTFGGATSHTFTVDRATDGTTAVSITNDMGLSNAGTPRNYTSSTAVAPTGNITQYLTSDGGAADGTAGNFCGPSSTKWYTRLGVSWKRANTMGNWLDAALVNEGSTAYASTAAATAVGQVQSATVTDLVARWLANGQNRGFYLKSRGTLYGYQLHGRTATTSGNRPTLTVVTSAGTTVLPCMANATWNSGTFTGQASALLWGLTQGSQPAILRFDLSGITGTLTSATLAFTVASFDIDGTPRTGQIADVFEADPPLLTLPENVLSPVTGLYAGKANFAALAGDAAVRFSDDFASPGWADTGWLYNQTPGNTYAPDRVLNTDTGTTYARGNFRSGDNLSAALTADIAVGGAAPHYPPSVVRDSLYAQYWLYLEPDFGTTVDTAIKIPSISAQFGYWNPVGYWASTTGNGGTPGTGLRVERGDGTYEYQGHSIRLLTGNAATSSDSDHYDGYFGIGTYVYHLDQVGAFGTGYQFEGCVIRTGQWYCIEGYQQQNTLSGSTDAQGNRSVAAADGQLRYWINGQEVFSKTDLRWRYHADIGVQGLYVDFYHGGIPPANSTMHYRIDRVTLADSYIGPALDLPLWVPSAGNVATLTEANGYLTNKFTDIAAPYFGDFYFQKLVNDFSTYVINDHFGSYGALMGYGGGHSATNDNTFWALELGRASCTFLRLIDPTPIFGSGTDGTTQFNNNEQNANPERSTDYGTHTLDGNPCSAHTYASGDIIAPGSDGAPNGTFIKVTAAALSKVGALDVGSCHQVHFNDTAGAQAWVQRTSNFLTPNSINLSPGHKSAHVPAQRRVYFETHHSTSPPRWFDLATNNYVTGTGAAKTQLADSNGGVMFHVPERSLVVMAGCIGGNFALQYMDVSVSQPTWVMATLGSTLAVGVAHSCACWCPDNSRILMGRNSDLTGVQEITIPATLTDPWSFTRHALSGGQTLPFPGETTADTLGPYKKWAYSRRNRAVIFMPSAAVAASDDTVHVYRPRNT